jgi:hypothetical protein
MTTKYYSKVGLATIIVHLAFVFMAIYHWHRDMFAFGFFTFMSLLLASCYFSIYYLIKDDKYLVVCAFFIKVNIPINEIKMVRDRQPFEMGPTLTILDRMSVIYGKGKIFAIAPRNKRSFCEQLRAINPSIEFRFREDLIE